MQLEKHEIAVLILAAGSSSRLGRPKQLLKKNGLTLLENTLNIVKQSAVGKPYLVLGANAVQIEKEVQLSDFQYFINQDWQSGMGASIAFGLKSALQLSQFSACIICMADQPYLSINHLRDIAKKGKSEQNKIIRSDYEEGSGPPVYFPSKYFPELLKLDDDQGAKPVVKKHLNELVAISFPKGNIDIDREGDLVHWS